MLHERSHLAAAELTRPRVVTVPAVLLMTALASAVLAMLYPGDTLLRRVYEVPPGPLTDSYVSAMLRTDPGNADLRLRFVERQLRLARLAEARALLAPLLANSSAAIRQRAAWFAWQIDWAAEGESERLRRELARLPHDALADEELLTIAEHALMVGAESFALTLLDELATRGPLAAGQYARLAQLALSRSAYQTAAQLWLHARTLATTRAEARRHFLAALRALQAGNLLAEALEQAERHLGTLADDREVLIALTELARAAGRGDLATRYARLLVRLSLLRALDTRLALGLWPRLVTGAEAGAPGLPYDRAAYELAYTTFVENGHLEDAYRVAAAAVRARPRNLIWRERLAQVAEWTGRPRVALEHWLVIAQRLGRASAWDRVHELARGLFDDERLILALRERIARAPQEPRWVRELAAAHERQGDPEAAVAVLAAAARTSGEPLWQRELALLHEKLGERPAAITAWRRYLDRLPGDEDARRRLVGQLVLAGDLPAARQALAAAPPAVAAGAGWRRLAAELAWQSGDAPAARAMLEALVAGGEAESADYERLLTLLPAGEYGPLLAAAEKTWRARRRPVDLQRLLALLAESGQRERLLALLAELTADERAALAREPSLVPLFAAELRRSGREEQALAMLLAVRERARELDGTLLWATIESSGEAAGALLRRLLTRHEAEWQADPALHDALAAAWLRLGEPLRALTRYLTPQLFARRDDFLWLMGYADALEQAGDGERAWQLRRQLYREFRQRGDVAAGDFRALATAAEARLALMQEGGDAQAALMRELLRLAQSAEPAALAGSAAARELALAWWIGQGEYSTARSWLLARHATRLAHPAWAAMTIALAEGDDAGAGELLETRRAELATPARLPAALRLGDERLADSRRGDHALAADEGFAALAAAPDDELRHQAFAPTALAAAGSARLALADRRLGDLAEREAALTAELPLGRLSLTLAAQRSDRDGRLSLSPTLPDETRTTVELAGEPPALLPSLRLAAGLSRRRGLRRDTPRWLAADWQAGRDLSVAARLGADLPAVDSTLLRLAGAAAVAELDATLAFGARSALSAGLRHDRYRIQAGPQLGSAATLRASASHRLHGGRPDFTVAAFWSAYDSRLAAPSLADADLAGLRPAGAPTAADFVPAPFRFYGLRATLGGFDASPAPAAHRRGPRPWLAVALTRHSRSGSGYEIDAGLAASVAGADHLALSLFAGRNGSGEASDSLGLRLSYQLRF